MKKLSVDAQRAILSQIFKIPTVKQNVCIILGSIKELEVRDYQARIDITRQFDFGKPGKVRAGGALYLEDKDARLLGNIGLELEFPDTYRVNGKGTCIVTSNVVAKPNSNRYAINDSGSTEWTTIYTNIVLKFDQ